MTFSKITYHDYQNPVLTPIIVTFCPVSILSFSHAFFSACFSLVGFLNEAIPLFSPTIEGGLNSRHEDTLSKIPVKHRLAW